MKNNTSLTSRLKRLMRRRSKEQEGLLSKTDDVIYDLSMVLHDPPPPQPRSHNPRLSSLFIELGELNDDEEDFVLGEEDLDVDADPDLDLDLELMKRRERMRGKLEEDSRKSWPCERLEALKTARFPDSLNCFELRDQMEKAKEQRRSLQLLLLESTTRPIPNNCNHETDAYEAKEKAKEEAEDEEAKATDKNTDNK